MRITFVHASGREFADTQLFGIPVMPVWAYTLAAHLAAAHPDAEITLVDDRFEDVGEVPEADLFLFSGINQDYDAIVAAERRLRQAFPRARFVLGGPICWSFHTAGQLEALAMFDHVVIGDGEETLPRLVSALRNGTTLPWRIETAGRFPLAQARAMHRPLLATTIGRYYGAVVEVSRGCPFLCEFCDIRVLPDNNRSHGKPADLIVAELDMLYDLGARQVLFACDNFIGDLRWADAVCDAILAWQRQTGKSISIFTWLTINVSRHPELLAKLRRIGCDLLFIGIESFSRSSLLETAKLQNTALEVGSAVRTIQSHGFVVVAGIIFGFDSDPDDVVDVTLRGILDAALISGDPSLLTALPGTPLYRRMRLAGRLRDAKLGLGGLKYRTNLRYLKPAARVRGEFRRFVREFNRGAYQYRRLRRFYDCASSPRHVSSPTPGYADVRRLTRIILGNRRAMRLLALRIARMLAAPTRVWFVAAGVLLTLRRSTRARPLWFYLKVWLVNWSNSVVKYGRLTDSDFDVASVEENITVRHVLPETYEASGGEQAPAAKIVAQRRATTRALRQLVQTRLA